MNYSAEMLEIIGIYLKRTYNELKNDRYLIKVLK